jgi:dTDP-4-dehydrorhamnose reductase
MIKILILGSTGLLGSTLLKHFSKKNNFKCYGAIRKKLDAVKLKYIKDINYIKLIAKKNIVLQKSLIR